MADSLAGVVLAAGAGRRLEPLTHLRPKALCPVAGRPLIDLALARLSPVTSSVAVNLHHGADQLDAHLPASVHRSFEAPEALGTAGALGALRAWIDGRPVVVTNADAWLPTDLDLERFVSEWDGERVRLLCVDDPSRGDFGSLRYCGVALMPGRLVEVFEPVPSGLYEVCWRDEERAGRLDLVTTSGPFVDCGTPAEYLRANLVATGGRSVVGTGATVGAGAELVRSVVWDGAVVEPGERLVDAVRAGPLTVRVHDPDSGGR